MKFLRNTATDFFTHNARLIFNTVEKSGGSNEKTKEIEVVVEEQRAEYTQLANDCTPKGIWSTPSQNELAGRIEAKNETVHCVQYGDTLGAIVKGMEGRLDYSRPVLYKSRRLTPAKIAQWNQKNTCFPIPDDLGQVAHAFNLGVVNAIYPAQIVYIKEINGVEYVIVDDGDCVIPQPTPSPKITEVPVPVVPEKEECEDVPTLEDGDCKELTGEQIWKGLEGSDEEKREMFSQYSDLTIENIGQARDAYLKLYGRKEWDKTGETITQDGLYVVIEKYFNPALKVPVLNMFANIFKTKSLAQKLDREGYDGDAIEALFLGADKKYAEMEGNINAKFGETSVDRNDGATKDFLLRLAAGAAIAGAMAAAMGVPATAPLLLAGLPLLKIQGKIKSFSQYPNLDEVYATLVDPNTKKSDMTLYASKGDAEIGNETNGTHEYLEIQKNALVGTDIAIWGANDITANDAALRIGPNTPDLDRAVAEGILTEEQRKSYENQDEDIMMAKGSMNTILSELALNKHVIQLGAHKEADDAAEGGAFSLNRKDTKEFNDIISGTTPEQGASSLEVKYTKAMQILIDNFNDKATKELDSSAWGEGEKLTMEGLGSPFTGNKEYCLGILPQKRKNRKNDYYDDHALFVKFVPSATNKGGKSVTDGSWKMYIKSRPKGKSEWTAVGTTYHEYRSAKELIGKSSKNFGLEDIQALQYNAEGFDQKEQRKMVEKLEKFDLMMAYVAQLNETKDLMSLTVETQKRKDNSADVRNRFDIEANSDRTAEGTSEYKYRVSLGSKLDKYNSFDEFDTKMGQYFRFTSEQKTLLKDVYNKNSGTRGESLKALVADEDFTSQIKEVACTMDKIQEFASIKDINEFYNCVKKAMTFSGNVSGVNSKYNTVTLGDLYLGYLVAQGALNTEISKTITEIFRYNTGTKNEAGEAIFYDMTIEKQISEKVRQWATRGWLDNAAKEAIIVVSGGRVTNMMIDGWANNPDH